MPHHAIKLSRAKLCATSASEPTSGLTCIVIPDMACQRDRKAHLHLQRCGLQQSGFPFLHSRGLLTARECDVHGSVHLSTVRNHLLSGHIKPPEF